MRTTGDQGRHRGRRSWIRRIVGDLVDEEESSYAKGEGMVCGAVVFDLDGTLVDSAPDLAAVLNEILDHEGWPSQDLATVASMVGDGVAKLVERGFARAGADLGDDELSRLVDRFLARYAENPTRFTKPFPGVAETLSRLRRTGYRLAVCTNKNHGPTVTILRNLDLESYFGAVIGGDSLVRRKPDPEPLLAALDELSASPSSAVMVGDSRNDVAAARAAGIPAITVSYGYGADSALGAEHTIDRFSDLPKTLESLK